MQASPTVGVTVEAGAEVVVVVGAAVEDVAVDRGMRLPLTLGNPGAGDPIAEQTASPAVGDCSMQRAPLGGSSRLSLQLPGWRVVPVQRRMMGVPATQYATSPVQPWPGWGS